MRGGEGEIIWSQKPSLTYKGFLFNSTNNFEITLEYTGSEVNLRKNVATYIFKLTMKKEGDNEKFEVTFHVKEENNILKFTINYTNPISFDVPDVKESKDKFVTVFSNKKKLEFPLSSIKNNDFFKLLKEKMNTKVIEILKDTASKDAEKLKKYQESRELQKNIKETEQKIIESFTEGKEKVKGYDDVYNFKNDLDEFKNKCSRLIATLSKNERDIFNLNYNKLVMLKITLEVKKKLLPPDDASPSPFDYDTQISLLIKEVEKWKNKYSTKCDELHSISDKEYNKLLTKVVNDKIKDLREKNENNHTPLTDEKIKKLENYVSGINKIIGNESLRNQAISKFFEYTLIDIDTNNPPQNILDDLSAIEEQLGIRYIREEPVKQREEVSYDQRGNEVESYKPPTHGTDYRTGETFELPHTHGVGNIDQREEVTYQSNQRNLREEQQQLKQQQQQPQLTV